ncbi:MAG: hypothetical protein ACXWQQ_13145 [Pseudobdellovibrio sp.]
MQLKLRQLILFLVTCLVLWLTDMPGGSLLAVASLMQLAILVYEFPFTKKTQLAFLKLFLVSFPVLLFWGAAHSFVFIYLNDRSVIFALMAGSLSLCLSFLTAYQMFFVMEFLEKNDFAISASLQDAFNEIRNKKGHLLKIGSLIFIFSLVPFVAAEWKIVFSLTATLLYLNQPKLKKVFSESSNSPQSE